MKGYFKLWQANIRLFYLYHIVFSVRPDLVEGRIPLRGTGLRRSRFDNPSTGSGQGSARTVYWYF
jgi:hypothetical protein